MQELNSFVVANVAHIPCTVRTLRKFSVEETDLKPWVHLSDLMDAILYLQKKAELPREDLRAQRELFENLSCSIRNLSASQDHHPGEIRRIDAT